MTLYRKGTTIFCPSCKKVAGTVRREIHAKYNLFELGAVTAAEGLPDYQAGESLHCKRCDSTLLDDRGMLAEWHHFKDDDATEVSRLRDQVSAQRKILASFADLLSGRERELTITEKTIAGVCARVLIADADQAVAIARELTDARQTIEAAFARAGVK